MFPPLYAQITVQSRKSREETYIAVMSEQLTACLTILKVIITLQNENNENSLIFTF